MRRIAALILIAMAITGCVPVEVSGAEPGEKFTGLFSALDKYIEKGMKDWDVPGLAVAVVRGDEIIYTRTFGVKRLGTNDPVTEDTIFQIGSTSKAFTCTLAAMLADEKKLRLDAKVAEILPDFKMYDPWVTDNFMVIDLMAQRSGLPAHAGDTLSTVGFSRQEILSRMRYVKPISSFRSKYAYQNNMFLAAAAVIEKVTGKSWEQCLKEKIFDPLGMTASSCDEASFVNSPDAAALHRRINGRVVALPKDWGYGFWVYTYGPAGGINSNIKDYAEWLKFQITGGRAADKQLISKEALEFTHLPQTITRVPTENGLQQYYCLGWVYRENNPYPIIWHNGGTSGHKTMIAMMPQSNIGIAVLSNNSDAELPEAVAFRFFDIYCGNPEKDYSAEMLKKDKEKEALDRSKEPGRPENPAPPVPLEKYTGVFTNDLYGDITVNTAGAGGLSIVIGPAKMRLSLKAWDADTFKATFAIFAEEEDAGLVRFSRDASGNIGSLDIEMLDEDGCGAFTRTQPEPAIK